MGTEILKKLGKILVGTEKILKNSKNTCGCGKISKRIKKNTRRYRKIPKKN